MTYCPSCGTALLNDALFCPECGTKTAKPETASTTATPHTTNPGKTAIQEQISAVPSTPTVETPLQSVPKKFCRNCGKEVQAGAFACMNCGLPPMKANHFCPTCGADSHQDAVICVKCGIKLPSNSSFTTIVADTKNSYCRNCGKNVLPGAIACLSCGLPPAKGNVYCQSCGSSTNPDAVICIKCGVKLGAVASFSEVNTSVTNTPNRPSVGNFQANNAVRTAAFWGSLMVLLGFYLPWVKGYEINGSQIAKFIFSYTEGDDSIYAILLYSMPVCAGIFIAAALIGNVTRFVSGLRTVPLLSLIILIVIILSKTDNGYRDNGGRFENDFFDTAGIGLILTIAGAIMMCFYNPPKD